jgi:hypothetical protein
MMLSAWLKIGKEMPSKEVVEFPSHVSNHKMNLWQLVKKRV